MEHLEYSNQSIRAFVHIIHFGECKFVEEMNL